MKKIVLLSIITLIFVTVSVSATPLDLRWRYEMTYTPAAPTAGETVQFSSTLKAGWEAADDVDVELRIDGVPVGRILVSHLDLGEEMVITMPWRAVEGTHTAMLYADPDNDYIENSDVNNSIEVSIRVAPGVFPADFDLNWSGSAMNLTSDPPNIGLITSFHGCVTALNSAVDNVAVNLLIDGAVVDSETISHIDAGLNQCPTLHWTATAGTHTASLIVDPANTMIEANEGNNTLTRTFTSVDPPSGPIRIDLKWTSDISFDPAEPITNNNVRLSGKYTVTGHNVNNVIINLRIDGSIVDTKTISTLTAGTVKTATLTWERATEGSHLFLLELVQGDSTIYLDDTTNNKIGKRVAVVTRNLGPSTLTTTRTNIQSFAYLMSEAACAENNDKTIDLVPFKLSAQKINNEGTLYKITAKIRNTGRKCVESFRWEIKDSYGQLLYRETASAPAGKSYALTALTTRTFTFNLDKRIVRETYGCGPASDRHECTTLKFSVDPNNQVTESNEANNEYGYNIAITWEN